MKMEFVKLVILFIKPKSSKTITLDVQGTDTIHYVKSRIREKDGILPFQQLLSLSGKLLEDNNRISDYNTKNDKTLHLILKMGDPMKIIIFKDWNMQETVLEVEPTDTLEKIKSRMQNNELVPKSCFFFNDQKLEDQLTLSHYKVENQSRLVLKLNETLYLTIFKEWNDEEIVLKVDSFDPTKIIKSQILNMDVDLLERCCLIFNFQELEDEKTLSHYKIQNDSRIKLKLNGPISIQILQEWNKQEIRLEVDPFESIKNVKARVLSDSLSRLFYKNVELDDEHFLCDYEIRHESRLNLFLVEKEVENKKCTDAHFVFLLNSSKSMNGKKWQAVCKSLKIFFNCFINSDFKITIAAFSEHTQLLVSKKYIKDINLEDLLNLNSIQTGVNTSYTQAFKFLNDEILTVSNEKISVLLMTNDQGEFPEAELLRLKTHGADKIKKFWSMGYNNSSIKEGNFDNLAKINSFLNGDLLLQKSKKN